MIIKSDINEKELEEISEIKKYFSRIFTVIPKEIKEKLKTLNISKEKKKILKKELAFLSKEKQIGYLDELERIYD
jgi:hypothetical protein